MKAKLILCLAISSLMGFAQIPPGYYNPANGLTGAALKTALHSIITGHTSISYAALIAAFDSTDLKPNGQIWDMYSDVPSGTPPYTYTNNSTDQCGSYNSEADCFNREHSWPQSWFNSLTPAYSDLFHIYPTDGYVNGKRNNYPYGEVSSPTWTSMNGSKLGPNTTIGYSQTVFEPIDEYKGDLARGYFYMTTRYMTEDAGWSTSDAVNKSVIEPWELCVLMNWHHQDPVSTKEINRNNAVYKFQNNRNPFIDHPEYADSIFSCTLTSVNNAEFIKNKITVFPNPAAQEVSVSFTETVAKGKVQMFDALGREILAKDFQNTKNIQFDVSSMAKGIYLLKVYDGKIVQHSRLLVE